MKNSTSEKIGNRKLFKYFDNILFKIAKIFKNTKNSIRDNKLWNQIINRYFLISPGLIKNNPIKIFKNLAMVLPLPKSKSKSIDLFNENNGLI